MAANLDSGGYPADVRVRDPLRSGIEAAALLEVARVTAADRDIGFGPDRTVLFAWFAGGAQGNAGLKDFLEQPLWPRSAVEEVLIAGEAGTLAGIPLSDQIQPILLPDGQLVAGQAAQLGVELAERIYARIASEYEAGDNGKAVGF